MVRLAAEEAEANGKIAEEVAITTTTTTTITEAEGPTEATVLQETEAATTTAIVPLATTPQATATRVMVQAEVEGRHGEAEVSCCCCCSNNALLVGNECERCIQWVVAQVTYAQQMGSAMAHAGRGRGRGRAAGRGPLHFPDPEDIKFLKVMKGHTKKVTSIALNPDAQQVRSSLIVCNNGCLILICGMHVELAVFLQIYTGSADKTLRIWHMETGQVRKPSPRPDSCFSMELLSPLPSDSYNRQ